MIPDDKKEEVRQAADIVDVVSDHVKLRRTGSNFTGLCPFHSEKTPSFSVAPGLGIYKCFGCGEGGDVFNFVMKVDGVGFEEAIRTLADRYNVVLPEKEQESYDPNQYLKDGIYHALRFAGHFYYRQLAESDEAEHARDYLQKRGYPWKTVRKYGLGYAPDRFDALLKAASDAGINQDYLLESGLIKARERGSGHYDTFRSRLMFPVFNPSGKVIAFGGRTLSNAKNIPKYINSPQTPVYNKSEVLYGIQVAKNNIRKEGEVILVEGYTDVISLQQAGIGNVVSTSGTSLTPEQVRVMKRYGDTVVMIFDADVAGVRAAVRGISIALEEGMAVRVLTLPEGEDPDSYVREYGEEGFRELRKKGTMDFLRYLVSLAGKEGRWDDPVERRKIISEILEAIAVMPDELSRINFLQELSKVSRIGDKSLQKELDVIRARIRKSTRFRSSRPGREKSGHPASPGSASGGPPDEFERPADHLPLPDSGGETRSPPSSASRSSKSGPQTGASTAGSRTSEVAGRRSRNTAGTVRRPEYEKELIRVMLTFGKKFVEFIGMHCSEEYFEDPELKEFYEDIMQRYQNGEEVSVEAYSRREHPYPELVGEIVLERHWISELGMKKRGYNIHKDADPYKTARGALKTMKIRFLEQLHQRLLDDYPYVDADRKAQIQEWIRKARRERNRYETEASESLFPAET